MSKYYEVVNFLNPYQSDDTDAECGHHHKTLETAHRCMVKLTAEIPGERGWRLSRWRNASVLDCYGKLTDAEKEHLMRLDYERGRS